MAIKNSGTDQLVKDGESTKLSQLHEQGIDVVSDVVQLLDDKSLGVRRKAAQALSEISRTYTKAPYRVLPRLRRAVLNDKDGQVVREVALAVGLSGSLLGTEAALKVLESAPIEPANRKPEDLEAAFRILEEIDSTELDDMGPSDASENLDKYIY